MKRIQSAPVAQEDGVTLLGGRLVWGLMMIRTENASEFIYVAQVGEYCHCQMLIGESISSLGEPRRTYNPGICSVN